MCDARKLHQARNGSTTGTVDALDRTIYKIALLIDAFKGGADLGEDGKEGFAFS
jgi:hypothetical protein